jgi:holo-[acyl-carrier protein] synthase
VIWKAHTSGALGAASHGMGVGLDIVQISRIDDSLRQFGAAFEERLFTLEEREYAHSVIGLAAQRLAARFAAKEAVIKALRLSEAGIGWRDIEVQRLADGDCAIRLHGRARELADQRGVWQILLSLSHDGDYAGAVVSVLYSSRIPPDTSPAVPYDYYAPR